MTGSQGIAACSLAALLVSVQALAQAPAGSGSQLQADEGAPLQQEFRDEYWDGHCRVVRSWRKGVEYREERTCKVNPGDVYRSDLLLPPLYVPRPDAVTIYPVL